MLSYLLLVTFCNAYTDTCDYHVYDQDLSLEQCIARHVEVQLAQPQYSFECVEEDRE